MDDQEWEKKITDIEEWRREKEDKNNILKEIEKYHIKQESDMKKIKVVCILIAIVLYAILVTEILFSY